MNLQFHITNNPDDTVANHLNNDARVNDTITLLGPIGSFTLNENSTNSLVFIAQGNGFAPVKGLIEHAMALDSAENIHLYWVASGSDGHYLHNLCRSWNDALDNFYYTRINDDGGSHWMEAFIADLRSNHDKPLVLDYYLCAGQDITAQIESYLAENRVPDSQLKTDTQVYSLQQGPGQWI
jgi:CDP-4-dehydro-6-deoxyglucose reductase